DQVGHAGQEVVAEVQALLQQHAHGDLVARGGHVDDVLRLGVHAERVLAPPAVALDPDDAVLVVALVAVGAAADRVLVDAVEHVLLGEAAPDVLGDDDAAVEVVVPLLVAGVGEGEADRLVVGRLDVLQPVPHVVEGDGLHLAEAVGEGDVLGGQRLAVGPGDALADLDLVRLVVGPAAALGDPGDEFGLVGVVVEERLVHQALGAGGRVPLADRVEVGRRAPLGAGRVERLVTGQPAGVGVGGRAGRLGVCGCRCGGAAATGTGGCGQARREERYENPRPGLHVCSPSPAARRRVDRLCNPRKLGGPGQNAAILRRP